MFGKLFNILTNSAIRTFGYLKTQTGNTVDGLKTFIWGKDKDININTSDDEFYDAEDFGLDDSGVGIKKIAHAFDSIVQKFEVTIPGHIVDTTVFKDTIKDRVLDQLFKSPKKIYMNLVCKMQKIDPETNKVIDTDNAHFGSTPMVVLQGTNKNLVWDTMWMEMLKHFSEYQKNGSNRVLHSIVKLNINTSNYVPLRVGTSFKLPPYLSKKRCIINMVSDDEMCFKWSITRACNPTKRNPTRVTKKLKLQSEKYNWTGISFPTPLSDITKFEENNPNVGVNILGYAEDTSVKFDGTKTGMLCVPQVYFKKPTQLCTKCSFVACYRP